MINWIYKGKEISSLSDLGYSLEQVEGFIYLIILETGEKYVGKKNFYSKRKKHFGKKRLAQVKDKRLKTYEYVVKESNWKSYTGSNKYLNEKIKSGVSYTKEILEIAKCKTSLTYLEVKELFKKDVLNDLSYLNDNILGKFYRKNLQ